VYRADPSVLSPRIAFALSRNVGSAVVRNRIRRRLRAAFATCAASSEGVPSGDYLLGAGPSAAELPFREVQAAMNVLVQRCRVHGGS
jgi:ribonuclease P protein component